MPGSMPGGVPGRMPGGTPGGMPGGVPDSGSAANGGPVMCVPSGSLGDDGGNPRRGDVCGRLVPWTGGAGCSLPISQSVITSIGAASRSSSQEFHPSGGVLMPGEPRPGEERRWLWLWRPRLW